MWVDTDLTDSGEAQSALTGAWRHCVKVMTMDVWESRSDSRRQTGLSTACLLVGLVLAIGLYNYGASGSNQQAGFLLGVVLTLIGAATLVVGGRQSVVVDPNSRTITISDHRLAGARRRIIAFSNVKAVQLAYLQTRSHQVLQYFLQLQLHDGEHYPLFAPGRLYPGARDPVLVTGWKTRLEQCLVAARPGPEIP